MENTGRSAPSLPDHRPAEKPPFGEAADQPAAPHGDNTPISALTRMDRAQWQHWLEKGGRNSYRALRPDLCERILDGIVNGVPVDFIGERDRERYGRNLPIRPEHEAKVQAVIDADVLALKKAGPFDSKPFPFMAVSPIGAVPKKNSTKVRVIHHLSYPFHGDSINAGIVEEELSLSSFGHAARAVVLLGKGCWLVKLDVEAAYKQVPVRREDWPLLGFKWKGKWFYERVLPFGLRSSCRLWELYATALEHLLDKVLPIDGLAEGDRVILHYVDDFLFVVKHEKAARALLAGALSLCQDLGLPMAADKTEGPTQCLTFLGIELDTIKMEARLPADKLSALRQLGLDWVDKEHASIAEIQSLCGILSFACSVVRPGRYYLRRCITFLSNIDKKGAEHQGRHAPHELSPEIIADVAWWGSFAAQWNGVSLLYEREWQEADRIEIFTDASVIGFGAYFAGRWYAGQWSPEQLAVAHRQEKLSMPYLELHALVQAAATFGRFWRGKKITFRCDCLPVVQGMQRCMSDKPATMALLRHFNEIACSSGFDYRAEHIRGIDNTVADALSRGLFDQFRALRPEAYKRPMEPVPIPLGRA